MLNEVLLTILTIFISGLLGIWLPGFILGRHPNQKNIRLISGFVIFVLILIIGRSLLNPDPQKQAEKILVKTPVFQTLKEKNSSAYQSLLSNVTTSAQNGARTDDLILDAQAKMMPVFKKYLVNSSDKHLRAFLTQQTAVLKTIRSQNNGGNQCYYNLFPRPENIIRAGENPDKAQVNAMLRIMNDVLTSSHDKEVTPPLSPSFAEPALLKVSVKNETQYGKDILLLDYPTAVSNDDERSKICDMTLNMYESLLEDPSPEASMALRIKASQ